VTKGLERCKREKDEPFVLFKLFYKFREVNDKTKENIQQFEEKRNWPKKTCSKLAILVKRFLN